MKRKKEASVTSTEHLEVLVDLASVHIQQEEMDTGKITVHFHLGKLDVLTHLAEYIPNRKDKERVQLKLVEALRMLRRWKENDVPEWARN